MTEADLLEQIHSSGGMVWSLLQYWTSVSFGILIAAHLAAKRLSWVVLSAFAVIYTLFTLNIVQLMRLQMDNLPSIANDLHLLAKEGVVLSGVANNFLENSPVVNQTKFDQVLRWLMVAGMFAVTIAYTAYCKIKSDD